jgi:hypothetical protein
MNLELTDEQAAALLKQLNEIIDGDRYFMSQRIRTLKEIRAKIRPEPVREPLPPPPKRYATPHATRVPRRRG